MIPWLPRDAVLAGLERKHYGSCAHRPLVMYINQLAISHARAPEVAPRPGVTLQVVNTVDGRARGHAIHTVALC
jgi:hypothetical protein